MPDLQQLIDEIRFRLQSEDCELTDDLKQLAADYAAVCHDVNGRLRRCGEHLKQGLRSEAIHLAESEPRLLDLVATVDFTERPEWEEVAGVYQLPRPEPLLLDVAEQLNEAYAQQQPLERLLDRHRRLALARAPLNLRLAVLRQLAKVDSASTIWEDDLKTFEKARTGEIETMAQAAAARGDRAALQKLVEEVTSGDWREPPPKALLQTVTKLADDITRHSARSDLQALAGELNAAFSEMDVSRCRALRQRWNELAATARLDSRDPLIEEVGPVLDWLADEDAKDKRERAYQHAVAALERHIADGADDLEDIRRAGHAVLVYERDMPEPLATRYRERVASLQLASRRHHRVVVGMVAGGALLATVALGVIIQRNVRAGSVKRVAESVTQLIGDNQLSDARRLLETNSDMSSWEPWLAAQKSLLDAETRERERKASWQTAIEAARSAATFAQAEPYLNDAQRLAATAEEKRELAGLSEEIAKSEREAKAAREARFREQIATLSDRVRQLNRLRASGDYSTTFNDLVHQAEAAAAELNALAAGLDPQRVRELQGAESRLVALKQAAAGAQKKGTLLATLTNSSQVHPEMPNADRNLSDFADALQKYYDSFPDDPRGKDFEAVARDAVLWRGAIAWQRLVDAWKDWQPHDLATARRRIDDCRTWLQTNANNPSAGVARDYLAYLESLAVREEGAQGDHDSGVRARLLKLFSGSLIDGIYCAEMKDGSRYYLPGEQDFSKGQTIQFNYLVGFAGELKAKTVRSADLKYSHARLAPQAELARAVRGKLPVVSWDGWDVYLRDLADSIRRDKPLDPFLRYFLLSRVLGYSAQGNSLLGIELQATLARLRDDKIDLTAKWMNPNDANARPVKDRAERALDSIGERELLDAWDRASHREQELAARLRDKVLMVGWLTRDETSGWVCKTAWTPHDRHQLQIAFPDLSGRVTGWTVIGTADPQKGIVIERAHAPDFKEGRPVFAAAPLQRPATSKREEK